MTPARQPPAELAELIAEITVDAYDEEEQLMSFENAFDEDATLPCPGTIIGHQVQVLSIGRANNRHELIATCQHNNRRYEIALLDIALDADHDTSRLIAAYRQWIGT